MARTKNRFEALEGLEQVPETIIPSTRKQIKDIPLDQIEPGPFQYRKYFSEERIEDLARIFEQRGMRGVLWVEPKLDESGKYLLISGERSWRAAKLAGFESAACEIIEGLSDVERAELGYLANEAPIKLNPIEDTIAILDILSLNLRLTHEDTISLLYHLNNAIARHKALSPDAVIQLEVIEATMARIKSSVGSWRHFTKNRLPLLKLPDEIMTAVTEGLIDGSSALEIRRLEKPKQRSEVLEQAIVNRLSYRDVKEIVTDLLPKPKVLAIVKRYRVIERRLPDALKDKAKASQIRDLITQLEKLIDEE